MSGCCWWLGYASVKRVLGEWGVVVGLAWPAVGEGASKLTRTRIIVHRKQRRRHRRLPARPRHHVGGPGAADHVKLLVVDLER